jgi:hypothetical protein
VGSRTNSLTVTTPRAQAELIFAAVWKINEESLPIAVHHGSLTVEQRRKVEAAMAIYRHLHECPQETVINAFVEGAALTPKGALTYWYNCRRKFSREVPE